jgi:N-acetylmuramoyl-L-alanine amidase
VNDANAWGADYFLSLHTNAAVQASATGSEAFVFSKPSVAASFAEDILASMSSYTGLQNRGVFARTGLYVLRRTTMPSVLLELGFITNARDAALMSQQPDLFARGIYEGILDYFGL